MCREALCSNLYAAKGYWAMPISNELTLANWRTLEKEVYAHPSVLEGLKTPLTRIMMNQDLTVNSTIRIHFHFPYLEFLTLQPALPSHGPHPEFSGAVSVFPSCWDSNPSLLGVEVSRENPDQKKSYAFLVRCLSMCCCCCDVPSLLQPLDCSPPGFSVHGVFQARIPERVAMPSSRESSRPRGRTHVSCIGRWFFTTEPQGDDNTPISKAMANTKTWLPVSPLAQFPRQFPYIYLNLPYWGWFQDGLWLILFILLGTIPRAARLLKSPKNKSDTARKGCLAVLCIALFVNFLSESPVCLMCVYLWGDPRTGESQWWAERG